MIYTALRALAFQSPSAGAALRLRAGAPAATALCSSGRRAFGVAALPGGAPKAGWVQPRPAQFSRLFMTSGDVSDIAVERKTVIDRVTEKISEAVEPVRIEVIPSYGDPDGSHISIEVVSKAFEGKRMMQRHQMVYKAIWDELEGPVHAVDEIIAQTPEEAGL